MWSFFVLVFTVPWAACQNGRDAQHEHHGHGWDIRLAVPGEPGSDYPTLGSIPRTSFSCAGREPGYYADLETNCQVFRVCTIGATYGFQSFLCPNGTLFNQEVFVCDWWMNVKCEKSGQLFNNNVERFGNLRLGPQLMKDIKKMLTYPMRNPYDQNSMRGNLVVMQDYRPPAGQLFPNGALLSGPERTPNNVYVPAKQIQAISQNDFNDKNDLVFAASTPEPRYLPAAFNTIQPSTQDVEFFQRQRQNSEAEQRNLAQNTQNQRGNLVSNGHTGRISQATNFGFSNNIVAPQPAQPTRPTQNYNLVNLQFGQKQKSNSAYTINSQRAINTQQGHFNGQISQYTGNNNKPTQLNSGKQVALGLARQQNGFNNNQEKQSYTYNTPTPAFINEINGQLEAKQNLVSTSNPAPKPTIIAKTLTLSRLVDDPKPGKPKSRITVKTWIVKPSKSGKLINPTPYTYNRPTNTPTEKVTDSSPYVYNKPTAFTQTERFVMETDQPYFYNRPTVAAKQIITTREPPQTYPQPTAPRPTFSGRQYYAPTIPTPPPTRASLVYLPPTTFKPAARIYLPPTQNEPSSPIMLAPQYLAPNQIQSTFFPGEQLKQAPSTATTRITIATTASTSGPIFSFTKQSQALVFSLLADSINVAKEYSNLAKQDTTPSTFVLNQLQDSEDVSPITNKISQLTSAQFGNNNINSARIVSTTQATPTANQFNEITDKNLIQGGGKSSQLQQPPTSPPQQTQNQYSARLQNPAIDDTNSGYQYPNSQNQIYSGQLYQLPVPVVTSQVYNRDSSANLVLPNIRSQNTNSNTNYKINSNVNSVEVTNAPAPALPARIQVRPSTYDDRDIFDNSKAVNDFLIDGNGISAQIQDQISGTIPHPLEDNKLLNYKKYQTSYVYTKLGNGINENILARQPVQTLPQNAKLIQTTNTPKVVTFQFIPSVSYQLDDEKDQQRILNDFQIDQFGSPRLKSGKIQDSNQGRQTVTSDISYTIDHTPSKQVSGQYNDISALYNGPSSYSAPQASIGNLKLAEVNYNSKLELENNNNNGYSRIVPAQQFNY